MHKYEMLKWSRDTYDNLKLISYIYKSSSFLAILIGPISEDAHCQQFVGKSLEFRDAQTQC